MGGFNMKLKPYSKYKDSGIQWIGKIPEGWEVRKVKNFSFSVAGGTPNTNNLSYWDGKIPWLPSGLIHNNPIHEKDVETFITFEGLNNSSTKWIKSDSILIALTGATCANIAYLTFKATANQSVIGIECDNKTFPKYIFYYLLSQREQILLNQTGGAQAGINKEDVKNLICAYPDKKEQTAIANFLDEKTSKIDQIIEKDKKLIALFKEKKTALINHAVTKGLNPDARMKDSGIEWIGKIPEGWEVERYKIRFRYIKGKIPENLEETKEEGYLPYLSMEYLRGNQEGISYANDPKSIKVSEGNLLLLWDGSNAGEFVLGKNGYLSSTMVKLNVENINPKFSWYLCKSFESLLRDLTIGMGIPHVNGDVLGNIRIPIPNHKGQTAIANFLDQATPRIDKTIKLTEKKINLLEEYKKSLIHNVVTGTVDVRGAVA